jgi:hypothetical protein
MYEREEVRQNTPERDSRASDLHIMESIAELARVVLGAR